jgi:hypothetical protein
VGHVGTATFATLEVTLESPPVAGRERRLEIVRHHLDEVAAPELDERMNDCSALTGHP